VRIGLLATSYPRFDGDPAGGFVAGHVDALRAQGHDVDVLAAGDGHGRIAGGRLFYTGGAPDLLATRSPRALADATAFTARLYAAAAWRCRKWDAVVAHWLAPCGVVAAALPTRAPLLAIAHGGDVHTLRDAGLLAAALHALARRRAHLAFVSAALRDVAVEAAPRLAGWLADAAIQPMGLDLPRFAAIPRAPASPPIVLVVARLVAVKGVDVAIDALALARRRLGAHLVVAGDGPDRDKLAARARANDLHATFVGEVTTRRRDELLATASVVAVPSRRLANGRTEGMPTIALEALAAGVPVVASRVGGLAALPAPPVHLVAPEDPLALARGLETALQAPPTAAALRACVAHLDWPAVATALAPSLRIA
jgi:glycosyltransferase involved in cell wall biosynthesis